MAENQERNKEAVINEIVDNLTLMDDDLMSKVFDQNIPATRLLLRTILGRDDIEVISVVGQEELQSSIVGGRKIRLDVVATDKTGVISNIEVQRKKAGAHPRRARFHSSMLDSRMLNAGQEFKELEDSHVIFITEEDYYKEGLPLYTIERQIRENGRNFDDGSHIVYVNGEYNGDDPLGKLMKDFKCKNAEDMFYPELAQGVKYFKEEEGRNRMSEAVERYAKKYAEDIMAEKEKVEAEKEKVEAENGKLEAEIEELRARLARYETT